MHPTLAPAPAQALDVRIMAHPARTNLALSLRDRLGALDPVIVWDTISEGPPSAMRTARRAWAVPTRAGATHRVVLQDDVRAPEDFADRLIRLLAAHPLAPVGLFAGWSSRTGQAVRLAAYLGLDWVPVLGTALSATGIALPEALATRYTDWADDHGTEERDSISVYSFLLSSGCDPVIAVPNLIQHDWPYTASLWPEKFVQGPRRSACYLDRCDGRTAGAGLGQLPAVPYLSPTQLRSRTAVYDESAQRFEELPSWRYARQLGFSTAQLVSLFGGADSAARRALAGYLDPAFQYEIWLTGFLCGRVLTLLRPGGAVDLGTLAAQAASRTLATGCLSRIVSAEILEPLADLTEVLVEHSLRAGLATAPGS
jgi:hypothetical protein